MSVRRPARTVLLPIHESAVGAVDGLAGQLEATHLSRVLAAGAAHLNKHKAAKTAGFNFCREMLEMRCEPYDNQPVKVLLTRFGSAWILLRNAPDQSQEQAQNRQAVLQLLLSFAGMNLSYNDFNYLRESGMQGWAYVVLCYLFSNGTAAQQTKAQVMISLTLHDDLMHEHEDLERAAMEGERLLGMGAINATNVRAVADVTQNTAMTRELQELEESLRNANDAAKVKRRAKEAAERRRNLGWPTLDRERSRERMEREEMEEDGREQEMAQLTWDEGRQDYYESEEEREGADYM